MANVVYILTGEIQTGKTTALMQWCKKRKDVYGILTPIINGKRKFVNVFTKEMFDMEVSSSSENILQIGKYTFSTQAFNKAQKIILQPPPSTHYLVIDEIGYLELKGKGLYDCLQAIFKKDLSQNIILVIRKKLLVNVIKVFNLEKYNLKIIENIPFNAKTLH